MDDDTANDMEDAKADSRDHYPWIDRHWLAGSLRARVIVICHGCGPLLEFRIRPAPWNGARPL
jgi:hypothetical protein